MPILRSYQLLFLYPNLSSPSQTLMTQMSNLLLKSQKSPWLRSYFLFSLLVRVGNFHFLPPSSLNLSSFPFILLLSPSTEPLISVLIFFGSKISTWLFLRSSISLLRFFLFYFVICFKDVHNCLLKPFYHSCFKICQIILKSLSSQCWHLWIIFFHSV